LHGFQAAAVTNGRQQRRAGNKAKSGVAVQTEAAAALLLGGRLYSNEANRVDISTAL